MEQFSKRHILFPSGIFNFQALGKTTRNGSKVRFSKRFEKTNDKALKSLALSQFSPIPCPMYIIKLVGNLECLIQNGAKNKENSSIWDYHESNDSIPSEPVFLF